MTKEETAGTEGNGEEKATAAKEKTKVTKAKPAKAEKPAAIKHNKGVWGLDLGQCGLKAIRLEERDGQVVATHFDYIEHAKILSQPDADKDALIREALETFLKRNSWKGDHLAIAVPGKSGLVRFVKLPPVEEKRIKDIVAFEARQQIPFSLEEVVWDFQKLGQGMVIEGMAIDTEIGLFAMKRDAIQRELQSYKDANMEVHTIQMSPLALANYLIFDQLKKDPPTGKPEDDDGSSSSNRCIAALDVGADESTLVVTNGGKTIMQRPVNIGGNHFTRALTKDLKLTFAKAEHIKRNATKGVGKDGPDLKTILAALKPVYSDFVNELQRALTYFSNTNRSAEITHLVGLGNAFKLPGLQKYLQEKLQIQVNLPESFERLDTREVDSQATFKDNLLSYAVSYGLALQGLNKGTLKVNLLPPEIRFERMIRAKKPMAAAAAALLLLGLGGMAWRNYVGAKPFIDSGVIAEVDNAKKAKSTVDAGKSSYDSAVKATDDEKRKVESSVAGQQERLNWLELYSFVNEALPHPDGTNLYSADAKPYFEGWRVPWIEWEKEIQAAPAALQAKLKKDREQLATEWSATFKVQPQQLVLLPLPANPLPDQKLETVHDQYTRARAAKQDFFRKMRGVDAYDLYANQRGLVREAAQGSNLPAGIADLPMVNIEAVNCRYTDKLDTFWNAATADPAFKTSMNDRVRPAAHLKTALEGAGWVVELRGYTFHWDAQNFLNKTLVENLAIHGIRPKVTPLTPAQLAAGA
ncbi:MAG: type IV pilus assembly protein PilM, partial [Gemmataceae bacterium]